MHWLYKNTPDNLARFVLGTIGENPIVCFGINPSSAAPNNLDPTVARVMRVATFHGFDSFIMLNVYAQRATDPHDLHLQVRPELKDENERQIEAVVKGRSLSLWAAWGNLIDTRTYLRPLLRDIVTLPALSNCSWTSRGQVTKDGHPRHPLYVRNDAPFEAFGVDQYW